LQFLPVLGEDLLVATDSERVVLIERIPLTVYRDLGNNFEHLLQIIVFPFFKKKLLLIYGGLLLL